ncbi:MAG: hypothetical protein ACLSGI_09990 [Butyricicoccaceae bacterium]|nr:hypothetical protein [Agathobaculum butyriciproducens]
MGDTYIKPLFALLLHCRTKAVSDCRFGYLQAQPPVYEAGKMIMGHLCCLRRIPMIRFRWRSCAW